MMDKIKIRRTKIILLFLVRSIAFILVSQTANAAIALDRTRVVFDGKLNSISISINNQNDQLPYLAQSWIEDEHGNKKNNPMIILPPVQRIEPGVSSQVKIQALPNIQTLPQDRESLYYFNLREIPPKSDKPNTLQIALQTRIKLFYRPSGLALKQNKTPWQQELILKQDGNQYVVVNPTPYFITIVDITSTKDGKSVKGFEPVMVEPNGKASLNARISLAGQSPVLTYINDYGGRPKLYFRCKSGTCQTF